METQPKSLPHSEPVALQEKKGLRINNSVFVVLLVTRVLVDFLFQNTYN